MFGSVPSLLVEPSTFRLPKVGVLKRKADATDMDVGSADFAGAKISLLTYRLKAPTFGELAPQKLKFGQVGLSP